MQRFAAVMPSFFVVALMEHDSLPVLSTVVIHGAAWEAGSRPQVDRM